MFEELSLKIQTMIVPLITELGLELIELNLKRHGKVISVQILADKPAGGITIEECTFINRSLNRMLEEQNLISDDYEVEVSSPGLDRTLKTQKDFLRMMGRRVRFHLLEKIAEKLEHSGIIRAVSEESVIVETKSATITIPLEKISKAVQDII